MTETETWPPVKMALWRVLMDEQLNDGHYIKAFDLIEKLYAAAQSAGLAPTPDLWRSIETAPKDGTEINGYRPDQGVFTFRWAEMGDFVPRNAAGDPTEDYDEDFAWWWHDRWGWMQDELTPTLWQPLPQGPDTSTDRHPLEEATAAQHSGLPKGEPARFVRNGVLRTCQCRDCRALSVTSPVHKIEDRTPEWLAGQKRIHDRERADRERSSHAVAGPMHKGGEP